MRIQINPKYKEVISVTQEDYNLLKQSIKENGQFQPIIVNEEGTILDGHLRYQACTELGIEPKFLIKQFNNILEEKRFVILSNLSRRNLNNYQKAKLAYLLEPIESELAKQRKEATQFGGGSAQMSTSKGKTRDIISSKVNIGHSTYDRAKYIMEHGSKKLQAQCESGEISVNSACTDLRRKSSQYKQHLINEQNKATIYLNSLDAQFTSYKNFESLKTKINEIIKYLDNEIECLQHSNLKLIIEVIKPSMNELQRLLITLQDLNK